jgi:DHA2 family multidrug resistance protein
MTYSETFYVLAVALLLCVPLALVLRRASAGPASPARSAAH